MVIHCAQSPAVSSIPQRFLPLEKPFLQGQKILKVRIDNKTSPRNRKIGLADFSSRASGSTRIVSQAQDVAASSSASNSKDKNVAFVAGATGKVGSRTVRELLKLGFKVRAGVRSIQRAEPLVQSIKNMKVVEGNTQPIDKLELVECDLEKPSQIKPALGNSSVVICCIGASEKEVFDVTGPYRIDYVATKNLVDAATSAKVNHFILLTSLGTNKFGFPAAILNLFWGVLCWKRRAEEALLSSGLPYTIVRPGGMERPTDSYKETHNITLSEEDTLFGGQVSNLQVAELLAFMAKNQRLSYCKTVEVIAETTAPLTPLDDLLKKIPSKLEIPLQESDDLDKIEPAIAESVSITEKEIEQEKITATRAQSPYAAYEDLKPPTSPTPTPSTGSSSPVEVVNSSETSSIATVAADSEPKKPYFLSPYPFYEGFKPPTSPTPTPSSGSDAPKGTTPAAASTTSVEVNSSNTSSVSTGSDDATKAVPKPAYFLSPYPNYEGLKPPSSPTPTPSVSNKEPSTIASENGASNDIATSNNTDGEPENQANVSHQKTRPLSPYTMYEDLKPPSSPSPSPKML